MQWTLNRKQNSLYNQVEYTNKLYVKMQWALQKAKQ